MLKKCIVGIMAGIISGLFSAGGGLILVPALVYLFKSDEKVARATTIFCILPMVITTGIFYYRGNLIDWELGIKCAIGGVIGGYIGSKLLKNLSNTTLRIIYAIFLIYMSYKFIFG